MSMIDDYPQTPTPPDEVGQVAREQAREYSRLANEGLSDEVLIEELGLTPPGQLARAYGPDIDELTSTTSVTVDTQELVGRGRYLRPPSDPEAVRRTKEAAASDPDFRPTLSPSERPKVVHIDAAAKAAAARAELLAAIERSRPLSPEEERELRELREADNPNPAPLRPVPPVPPTPPRRPTTE